MIHELTIYKLGKLLNELKLKYNMNLLLKRKLSGGFITIVGEVDVNYIPEDKETLKGNNIIGLKVKNDNGQMDLKITGIKGSLFKVEIAPTKFKEITLEDYQWIKLKKVKKSVSLR